MLSLPSIIKTKAGQSVITITGNTIADILQQAANAVGEIRSDVNLELFKKTTLEISVGGVVYRFPVK